MRSPRCPVLAVLALASGGCSDQGFAGPSSPAEAEAAVPPAIKIATSSCTVEGTGPYLVHTRWSGLSVYTLKLIQSSTSLEDVRTFRRAVRSSTTGATTLNFQPTHMQLFNKRSLLLATTACVTGT